MSVVEPTAQQLRKQGGMKWTTFPGSIGAWVAEMDFGVADPIRDAVAELNRTALFGYLPPSLKNELCAATAAWVAAHHGWDIPSEWVFPVPDVLKGFEAAITYHSEPGSPIVVPTPAYMPFLTIPKLLGREVIQVPMIKSGRSWELDLAGIAEALSSGGMLVFCNPHNPLGKVHSTDEMLTLADVVESNNARVFADEVHSALIFTEAWHVSYANISESAANHTVTAVSASKAWNLPGLKCAQFVVSNERDANVWAKIGGFVGRCVANSGVVATIAAYRHGEQWLAEVKGYLKRNRKLLRNLVDQYLPEVGYIEPDATYLAWMDCRAYNLAPTPRDFFLGRANVAMVDGALCGDVGVGHVRFNFATTRAITEEAFAAMGGALAASSQ
jgi:cystathionine beta-lyase